MNLDALRATAEAAKEGGWESRRLTPAWWVTYAGQRPTSAQHIAAFDPPTVLALLDRLAAVEAVAADMDRRALIRPSRYVRAKDVANALRHALEDHQ